VLRKRLVLLREKRNFREAWEMIPSSNMVGLLYSLIWMFVRIGEKAVLASVTFIEFNESFFCF